MKNTDIPDIARQHLAELLSEPGGILYSGAHTLAPGDVYLLGFNPGGGGGRAMTDSIDDMLIRTENAYVDEQWESERKSWGKGEHPLQKGVRWVADTLGLKVRDICASNLIFTQSANAAGVDYALAKRCWPVHEAILEIVQPRLIVAIGNSDNKSAYSFLRNLLGAANETFTPAHHDNWSLCRFETKLNGQTVTVAGFPHFSYYSPEGKPGVQEWLFSCWNTVGEPA